ncbi:MAG: hypothetical protein WCB68_00065 [Pyrinomonadaceae bacterium]
MKITAANVTRLAMSVVLLLGGLTACALNVRAQGNAAAGIGKLTICDHIDDDWKCVGAASPWPADKPFNILLELPQAIEIISVGFVIHKSDEKGVDTDFVDEFELMVQGKARLFATTEGMRLPAGRYTVYGIYWTKRQVNYHPGNFKEYLGKTELIVK